MQGIFFASEFISFRNNKLYNYIRTIYYSDTKVYKSS